MKPDCIGIVFLKFTQRLVVFRLGASFQDKNLKVMPVGSYYLSINGAIGQGFISPR
jgi:hypothetical protein